MSAAQMTDLNSETSPRFAARIAGVVYLLTLLTGVFGLIVSGSLFVSGDATATATNILARETSFRLGYVLGLVATPCYIAVTALFYNLSNPVNRSVSLIAAFFSLVGCAIGAVSSRFQLMPLTREYWFRQI